MNNILYLFTSPERKFLFSEDKYFWTMCSGTTEYCRNYRKNKQIQYCGTELVEIGRMECTSETAAKKLQLDVNMVFKTWTRGGGMKITIDMQDSEFVDTVKSIYNSEDCKRIMYSLLTKYRHPVRSGVVYLVKCRNNKLKIGTAYDMEKRFAELVTETNNQAVEIVDTFKSKDTPYDEAMLHLLCDEYKTDGNKEVTQLQGRGNSELFIGCPEVIEIWTKYKETKHD